MNSASLPIGLALPLLLASGASLHSSAPPPPQSDVSEEIRAAELSAHVKILAGDALEGRRAGTQAADEAARYIAEVLRAAGVEPAGDGGGFLQEFEFKMAPEPGECSLTVGTQHWTDVSTVAASPSGDARGALIPVGFGVVSEEHRIDEYAGVDVEGKLALIRRYTSFGPNADPDLARLGNLRKKIKAAANAGAIGVVLGTHPEEVDQGGKAEIRFSDVRGTMKIPVVTVDPARFLDLSKRCETSGEIADVSLSATVIPRTGKTSNVIGRLPGATEEYIVVGAHYDHLGWGSASSLAPGTHAIHNGADDNASGTAVVLEVAEAWAAAGDHARGVVFALWSAEEEGLLGSAHWTSHPTVPIDQVLCYLNLDMVGRPRNDQLTVSDHATAKGLTGALQTSIRAMSERGLDLTLDLPEDVGAMSGGSDHMSFLAAGIPVAFYCSGLHSDYHKPTDDWEKLDYAQMAELGLGVTAALEALQTTPSVDLAYIQPPKRKSKGPRKTLGARVWFGSIPDYAARPEGGGLLISGTSAGSPAERAGLQGGDIIKRVGRFAIVDILDFMDMLGEYKHGDTVTLMVQRGSQELSLMLTFFPRSTGD